MTSKIKEIKAFLSTEKWCQKEKYLCVLLKLHFPLEYAIELMQGWIKQKI
jgi:hypothetical protein